MKKTRGARGAPGARYSRVHSRRGPTCTGNARPTGTSSPAVRRTDRCSGMITAVGTPAAAWHRASPATASASPPVCAYGAYSATTCTTPTGPSALDPSSSGGGAGARQGPLPGGAATGAPSLGSRGLVTRRVAPQRGHVVALRVLLHHPARREPLADGLQG